MVEVSAARRQRLNVEQFADGITWAYGAAHGAALLRGSVLCYCSTVVQVYIRSIYSGFRLVLILCAFSSEGILPHASALGVTSSGVAGVGDAGGVCEQVE